jgi:hypothetical protein
VFGSAARAPFWGEKTFDGEKNKKKKGKKKENGEHALPSAAPSPKALDDVPSGAVLPDSPLCSLFVTCCVQEKQQGPTTTATCYVLSLSQARGG